MSKEPPGGYLDIDDTPAVRFVNLVLLTAKRLRASQIVLRRSDGEVGAEIRRGDAVVEGISGAEFADAEYEGDVTIKWGLVVGRLKVMARMVDYGPNPSKTGQIFITLGDGSRYQFEITENPDPRTCESLLIRCGSWEPDEVPEPPA